MATAARLALSAWRNEDRSYTLRVRGLDLTNVPARLQARLMSDTPGPALLDLKTGAGIAVTGLVQDAGVPVSTLTIVITKAALQALPYAGELGDATALDYALQLGGETRLFGKLWVLASPIDSDNAPAKRPPSYGGYAPGLDGAPQPGATLTIVDDVVEIVLDGGDQLGPLLKGSQDARDAAVAAAASVAGVLNLVDANSGATGSFDAVDPAGFAVPLAETLGYQHSFGLSDCDTILVVGDSISEGIFYMKDKTWSAIASARSSYRFINQSLSGDRIGYMLTRVFTNDPRMGNSPKGAGNARFALVMGWVNEPTPDSWVQNMPKLVDLLRARGAEPVFMTEAGLTGDGSYNSSTYAGEYDVEATMARRLNADLIEAQSSERELLNIRTSFLQSGVHPGTRTGTIYASRVIKWARSLPRPERSIKIYGVRATYPYAALADLLFGDDDDMARRFKEISIGHRHYDDPTFADEIDNHPTPAESPTTLQIDQYARLETGGTLTMPADYTLLRIAVPGAARDLDAIGVEIATDADAIYVLDRFAASSVDTAVAMGAWVPATWSRGVVQLDRETLTRSMRANEIYLLVHKAGGATLASPRVHYSYRSSPSRAPAKMVHRQLDAGPELLQTRGCASLNGWGTAGNPVVKTPFDLPFGAPRDPANSAAGISGVIEVTAADTITQSIALPAVDSDVANYRLRVYARYWPKPFLDNSHYGFPAAEVIDRSAAGVTFANALVQPDSFDFRTLRLATGFEGAAPTTYNVHDQLVGLYWTPIDFTVSMIAAVAAGQMTFTLSCPDGVLQIGKVSLKRVTEYVHRV